MTRAARLTVTNEGLLNDPSGEMFEHRVRELLKAAAADPSEMVRLALEVQQVSRSGAELMAPRERVERFEEAAMKLAEAVLDALRVEVDWRDWRDQRVAAHSSASALVVGPQVSAQVRPLATLLVLWRTFDGFRVELFDGWSGEHPPEKIVRSFGRRLHERAVAGWLPEFGPGEFAAFTWPG